MATIPSGYASSVNTGVPDGTQLKVYTGPMTITKAGTVIDGMIINGSLTILADNVVIKNSQITYSGWWGIDGGDAKNLTVQDSTIVGPGYGGDTNAGILGNGTFLRNDVSKSENGIVLSGGSSVVKGNYIHDLQDGVGDPHYDGIAVQGGQNGVVIEGNTVESRDTSAIFIKNDFGAINNVVVKGNYLTGDAGYQIYVDGRASGGAITNVQILNNYVEKGYYGYYSIENSSPSLSGNVELGQGGVPPALSGSSSTPSETVTTPAIVAPATPSVPVTTPTTPSTSGSANPVDIFKQTGTTTSESASSSTTGSSFLDALKAGSDRGSTSTSSASTSSGNSIFSFDAGTKEHSTSTGSSVFDFSFLGRSGDSLSRVADSGSSHSFFDSTAKSTAWTDSSFSMSNHDVGYDVSIAHDRASISHDHFNII